MTKVSGSYESVVRGVSEQVPQDRLSGQHWEQVNTVPDPVRGLARRHGSVTEQEDLLPNVWAPLLANTASHRTFTFSVDGAAHDLIYRTQARATVVGTQDTFFCYNRTTKEFVPVVLHSTAGTANLVSGGVSAITRVGRFVLMGANTHTTTWTSTEKFDVPANKRRFAVWVRGGGYSRNFSMTLKNATTGVKVKFNYKTKSASYPTLLDTSDLLTANPDYQKLVNDRVNDYNGKVTQWIGEAAADITPENIATKLRDAYVAAGHTGATIVGSTILIDSATWSEVEVDDGGDGSLIEAVGNVVASVTDLCPVHWVGKVVQVQPSKESPENRFFMEAYPETDGDTGTTQVVWRESAGEVNQPLSLFFLAAVEAGTMYISDDLAWLETQLGASPGDVPPYKGSDVGDGESNPIPHFLGKQIDFLAVFQDRLAVGSGPVISFSKPGDYFNFFRTSTLTLSPDDPVEEFALGSEEDVIKHAVLFNRDLILFGQRGQYAISGRQPLTPMTAGLVATVSKYAGSIDATPRTSGNFAFYAAKRGSEGTKVTSLQQIQPAALSDNPESQDVSQQLDEYLKGTVVELATITKPNTVVLRTDHTRTGLYLYNYLDNLASGQRLIEAWHRWEWSPLVGHAVGMSADDDGDLLVYVIRQDFLGRAWLACERFSLSGVTSSRPYLDAARPENASGSLEAVDPTKLGKAFGTGPNLFVGSTVSELLANPSPPDMAGSWLGILFDSYVTPTNPFPKDNNGRAITFGRFTLGQVRVTVADTGGVKITSTRFGTTSTLKDTNGFVVGAASALPDTQPLINGVVTGFVGAEVRECKYTLTSKRWLPLTITSIEWAGQIFNRQRRA